MFRNYDEYPFKTFARLTVLHRAEFLSASRRTQDATPSAAHRLDRRCLFPKGTFLSSVERTLAAEGLTLPAVAAPVAAYVPAVRTGQLVFTSGQLPLVAGELSVRGKVGADITPEEATAQARTCILNALAAIKDLVGDLDQISRIVKLVGFVASAPDFTGQPGVVNGASELLQKVFGDAGMHARSAVGVAALPLDAPVEVELVVELTP